MQQLRMLNLFLILAMIFGNAWSSEPEKIKANTGNQTAKYEQRGTENSPIFVNGEVTTKKNKEEARDDADERKFKADIDKALVKYTGGLAVFTFLLFVFTAALWWVTLQLSRDAQKSSARQAREMEKVLAISRESADAARKSADVAEHALTGLERQETATKTIERAYVKMSHTEDGIEMPYGYIRIRMKIENLGNTPADVIDVLMCPIVLKSGELLPEIPPYRRQGIPKPFHAYLIKNDHFSYTHEEVFKYGSYTPANGEAFYIIGYVDYVDKFSMLHRFGYARRHDYDPMPGECNLAFVNQAGYNYDKECGKYEGNSSKL